MKKILLILTITTILCSCKKNKGTCYDCYKNKGQGYQSEAHPCDYDKNGNDVSHFRNQGYSCTPQ